MILSCPACGKRFRSMSGEAKHRHNFPALCVRNKRFHQWRISILAENDPERLGLELEDINPRQADLLVRIRSYYPTMRDELLSVWVDVLRRPRERTFTSDLRALEKKQLLTITTLPGSHGFREGWTRVQLTARGDQLARHRSEQLEKEGTQ